MLIDNELLTPGNYGIDCIGNGEHYDNDGNIIECQCDECDFMIGCLVPFDYDIKKIHEYMEEIERSRSRI